MADLPRFLYPVPPRRDITTGTTRLVPASAYRAIWRTLALLLLLQVLDLLITVQIFLRAVQ